jgi:methylmalonyl-CoA carboxyltransferase large subunit
MPSETADRAVIEALEALRQEVIGLGERVAALEANAGPQSATNAQTASKPQAVEEFSVELVAVISAALAAYLGVKPHIRQISLVGGASWAQQGRVTIQASHALTVRHD